jgi:hypothetical protein
VAQYAAGMIKSCNFSPCNPLKRLIFYLLLIKALAHAAAGNGLNIAQATARSALYAKMPLA